MAGPLIRSGDKTSRPIHGNGTIASGGQAMIVGAKPAARHGDPASCGALLIAGQQATLGHV